MRTPMKAALLAFAGTLASLTAIAPAAAEVATRTNTTSVQYADLNLSHPEGQAALERRIDRAARKVCGLDQQRTGTRLVPLEDTRCYRQAKAEAKKQVAAAAAEQQLGG
ncbi:UrcA family protein [Altererythrobacter sp. H2]|uniref:UrcA family protein n=1 Tax=Altererythrobacter sp. H2 TaxID=3108391 RepID=UPI000BD5FF5E|nr:UrcA family protein [Altererythrobacter sp. H2]OZA92064.1 MAG: hypothetical protein B7X57_09025 [Erythrobacter sp. 34-65-8]WRK96077.1 UrcA family protein [Altererythrobacter sp. H2]